MTSEKQCEMCHIGLLQSRRVTYAARLGKNLLLLPGIDVSICDVCGETLYNSDVVARIEMLVGMELAASAPPRRAQAADEYPADTLPMTSRRRSA